MDESGQMGIGTTSPDRTIHCHNSSNTTNVRAKFSNGTTGEGASDGFEIGINASDPAQAVLVNYEASPMAVFYKCYRTAPYRRVWRRFDWYYFG